MGEGQSAGDVGKAAGGGVRGIWEEKARRHLYSLPLLAGYSAGYIILDKSTVIFLWLKLKLREVKSLGHGNTVTEWGILKEG